MALVRAVLRASSTQGHLVFEAQEKLPPWRCSTEAVAALAAASSSIAACTTASGTVAAVAGNAINHCLASGTLEAAQSNAYIFLQARRLQLLGKFLGVAQLGQTAKDPPKMRIQKIREIDGSYLCL